MGEIKRFETGVRYSTAVVHNGTVYLAGQVADQPGAPIEEQVKQVLANVERALALAGSDKSKLLSVTVWLSNMGYFDALNEQWNAWVPEGCAPARACVESHLARPGYFVELGVIAAQ